MPSLKAFLSLRKRSVDGSFDELAARAFIAWEDNATVDPSEEHSLRANLGDYRSKLTVRSLVLPDPFTLKDGWLNEQGRVNWPSINFNDIASYLKMTTPSELYHRLYNEYKQGKKTYRYFTGGLVKEVHYHPINDQSTVAFLSAKVTPSMRFRCPPYEAWVCVEKDMTNRPGGEIYIAYCTCTAGLKGCCNHVAAILFRVEHAVRTGLTKPSSTSQTCVWNAPSVKAPSNPIKLSEQILKKDQYFKQSDVGYSRSVRHLATVFSPLTKRQEDYVKKDKIKSDLADLVRQHAPESCFLQLYERKPFPAKPMPVCPPCPTDIAINLGHPTTAEEVASAMVLTEQQISELQAATVGQSDCEEWMKQRCGRITAASNFHRVFTRVNTLHKNPDADPNSLIRSLMGYSPQPNTLAIKHGKSMEPHAKKAYHRLQTAAHKKFKSEDWGLFVHTDHPFLGASPNLLVSCECGKTKCDIKGLCEIKCPESIKDQIPSTSNWKHLVEENSSVTLSKSSPYYTQIQGQMAILKASYCDFFVYTAQGHYIEKIYFHERFWKEVEKILLNFG